MITKDRVMLADSENDSHTSELLGSMPVASHVHIINEEAGSEFERNDSGLHSTFGSRDDVKSSDKRPLVTRKSSFLSSIMQVADRHTTKALRPSSAPSRSTSSVILTSGSSTTLPSHLDGSDLRLLREKQCLEDIEKQKRRENIEQSARAALHYSAKRRSLKTMSLPRDHRSASHSSTSSKSGGSHLSAFVDRSVSSACCQDENSLSGHSDSVKTPVDEVKEVPVLQHYKLMNHTDDIDKGEAVLNTTDNNNSTVELQSSDHYDNGGSRSGIIEENDIMVSFEESQSLSVGQQAQGSENVQASNSTLTLPHAINDERSRSRHRAASFSNKRKKVITNFPDIELFFPCSRDRLPSANTEISECS